MQTALLLLLLPAASLQAAGTQPFPVGWRENPASIANVSFLLDVPAGRNGFIRVANGHLVKPDGSRFRIWGVNFTAAATTPSKEDAPAVADLLARFGINCVRFHFLDSRAPRGLIDDSRNDTRALDPKQLDRLDFFIAELKRHGIYSNLNLNVGRIYKAGDGVRDFELIGFAKALTYFDPRLLELQREYARQLLTHRNPYTNSEYRSEPAVVIVELVNENSIVESWFGNRLLGRNTHKDPGTWTDIPASYEKALTEKFHAWLKAGKLPPVPRLHREEFAAAPKERFHREAEFYMEMERNYFRDMAAFLKNDLGLKALVAGTSDHGHSATGYPLLASTSQLDIVDGHVYWQHPSYITDPATGKQTGFTIGNTPMVNDPAHSTVVELSRSAVEGKPYTVSEVNHPFPAEYAAEGIPILAAYAAFHDWDGIFWYTFEHKDPSEWQPVQPRHFEIRPDPVKMAQLAAGALLFLRGDVKPARQTVQRSYTREQVYESIRLPRAEAPFFTPGFAPTTALEHATRIQSFNAKQAAPYPPRTQGSLITDTNELAWYEKPGVVVVDTPRSQALIGFARDNPKATANLGAALENRHCAITLSSIDGQPIARASRLLLTAGSRVENTGMKWNEKRNSLVDWGKAPTRIETVVGTVTLRDLARAREIIVTPLDSAGRAMGEAISAERQGREWEFTIGKVATVWYGIEVRR